MRGIPGKHVEPTKARVSEVIVCSLVWSKPGIAFQATVLRSEATQEPLHWRRSQTDMRVLMEVTDGSGYTVGLYHKELLRCGRVVHFAR
jgi:hypothetical protein